MSLLSVQGISKHFKDTVAVDNVSFDVTEGEFLSLLGPSGCGKTTTLRIIAGLENLTQGKVFLEGRDVTEEAPFHRNTGMVFQNYALFPHMTIHENVAFGLRMRKFDKNLIEDKVNQALELVHLGGLGERYPHQLSGGQQQRVALARALAVEPALLLLDEPLSNLDAKLREEMRIEIKLIQREVGITTLFVTHDQEEALTMSDRVIVMEQGRISEMGSPIEIYQNPSSAFVADFIGHANIFKGKVIEVQADQTIVQTEGNLDIRTPAHEGIKVGDGALVAVKQERIQLDPDEDSVIRKGNCFSAELILTNFLGPTIHYICKTEGHDIHIRRPNEGKLQVMDLGQSVRVHWDLDDCVFIRI